MLFPAYWRDDLANNWYVIGLNYPGIPESGAGGYHLGPNQIMNHDVNRVTQRTLTTLQQDFCRIRNMGCRVVRMWAFTQGQGLRWQEINSEWIVTRIDPDFQNNVREITARAAQEGIKIYWTLFNGADFIVDTHDGGQGNFYPMFLYSWLFLKYCYNHHASHLLLSTMQRHIRG